MDTFIESIASNKIVTLASVIITIISFAVALFTLIIMIRTFSKNTRVNKCSYLLTIDKYFAENKDILKIYKILSDYNFCPELCSIESVTSSELSTYLTLLENFNILIKKKVITIEELYNLFGHRIFSALHNKEIQVREITKYQHYYDSIFMLHQTLFLYCIEK